MKQTLSMPAAFAMTLSMGCSKKDEPADGKGGADKPAASAPASDTAAAEETAPDKAAPAADKAGDTALVCCEFSGAIGTATKEKCIEFKGEIVEGLAPPCTK